MVGIKSFWVTIASSATNCSDNLVYIQLEQLAENISILLQFGTSVYNFSSRVLIDCGYLDTELYEANIVSLVSVAPAERLPHQKVLYRVRKWTLRTIILVH